MNIFFRFLNRIFSSSCLKGTEWYALSNALQKGLSQVNDDLDLWELETIITSSTGMWLDEYGSWFGLYRMLNECDEDFRARILAVAFKVKNTVPAIISTVDELAGYNGGLTNVFEPFTKVAKYSISKFSGSDRFQDNNYWRHNIFDVQTPYDITEQMVYAVNKIKAGGVKAFFTKSLQLDLIDDFRFNMINAITDYHLIFDIFCSSSFKGAVFSEYGLGSPRMRSGRKSIFGVIQNIYIDFFMSTFKRLTGDSRVITRKDFDVLNLVPKFDSLIFSLQKGALSGDTIKNKYETTNEYNPDNYTDLQGGIDRLCWELRPADFSRFNIRSGKYSLCGAPNDLESSLWREKGYVVTSDVYTSFMEGISNNRLLVDTTNFIDLNILDDHNGLCFSYPTYGPRYRSGNKCIFTCSYVEFNTVARNNEYSVLDSSIEVTENCMLSQYGEIIPQEDYLIIYELLMEDQEFMPNSYLYESKHKFLGVSFSRRTILMNSTVNIQDLDVLTLSQESNDLEPFSMKGFSDYQNPFDIVISN